MNKKEWKKRIEKASKDAGTYRPFFDAVIETLADIMAMRDNAQEKFDASGGQTIVKHTNKAGATNIVKNPALVVLMECNTQALSYWRDLGLTPSGLKKLNSEALADNSGGTFAELLAKI